MNIPLNKAPITPPRKLNWNSVLFLKAIQFTIKFQLNWLSFQAGETCPVLLETLQKHELSTLFKNSSFTV